MKRLLLILIVTIFINKAFSQSSNDVLNLLIANKTITQEQADSIRAEAAIKQQKDDLEKTSFAVEASKKIKLSGFTQIRYQNFGDQSKNDALDLRRARLTAKGPISPTWNYTIQVELATATKLLDAYAEYKHSDKLKVQIGNIKTPISLENNSSTDKLESIDLSQVVEALCSRSKDVIGNHNGLDLGVKVTGDLFKRKDYTLINYAIGVFNGTGINVSDNNKSKDLGGRLVLQPIKNLKIGGSLYSGYAKIITTKTSITTTLSGSGASQKATSKSVTTTTFVNQARNRVGLELSYEIKKLSLRAEYLKGQDGRDATWRPINKEGYYAQVGYYVIAKKLQIIAKYDNYDKCIAVPGEITTNYGLIANYNFNPSTRIQAGYSFGDVSNRPFKGIAINSPYNFGVVQFQIGF